MTQKMAWRRGVFALLVMASVATMLGLMTYTLGIGGLDVIDWLILSCFAVTLPWLAIGFWNAVIGFALMRLARDPAALAAPVRINAQQHRDRRPNRHPGLYAQRGCRATAIRNLAEMIAGLIATGAAPHLHSTC